MPEEVLLYDLPDMEGLTAVAGRGLDAALARHVHGSHVLGLVDAGERVVRTGEDTTRVPAGRLFAVAAGLGHRCEAGGDGPHSYRALCFAPGRLAEALAEAAPGTADFGGAAPTRTNRGEQRPPDTGAAEQAVATSLVLPTALPDDPEAADLLRRFFALLPPRPETVQEREELARALARRLAAHSAPGGPARAEAEAVRRAMARIEADPAASLTLAELAGTACLSPWHFQRAFTAQTGVSPREWQLAARVRKARALIDRGLPLAEAALACGFADQSHFNKSFKRVVGTSPGRYLRANAPAPPPGPAKVDPAEG